MFTRAVGLAAALAMMGEPTRKADMVLEWVVGVEEVRCDVALFFKKRRVFTIGVSKRFSQNLVKTRHLPHLAARVISLTNSYEPNTK